MTHEKDPREGARGGQFSSQECTDQCDSKANNTPTDADVNAVREFLTKLGGPWHICPAVHWAGYTFDDIEEAVAAATRANEHGCVYFLANTPKRGRLSGRSRKKWDIARVDSVFLDVDDPDPDIVVEFDRLGWRPTYVSFTGGGWQAMWRLSEPTTPADGEAIAVWLQSEFEDLSPDSTHSCEHIFRLPGTRNRKAGRSNRLCELVSADWSATLPVGEAGRLSPQPRRRAAAVSLSPLELDEGDLWEILPPWAVRLVNDPTAANGEPFPSRNEHEFAFVGACLRDGTPPDMIASLLLLPAGIDETHRVSHRAHWAKVKGLYVPRRNPLAHAERQIGAHPDFGGSHE
ncbi:MAG: hypothetical protein AAGJ96_08655 [Pseudomonadota bacterium]